MSVGNEKPRPHWATRVPWLVVGAVIGALCVQTWPGQTERAAMLEMGKWVGGGMVAGIAIDFLVRTNRLQLTTRALFWLVVVAATVVALANGDGWVFVVLSIVICWVVVVSLMRGRKSRIPPAQRISD